MKCKTTRFKCLSLGQVLHENSSIISAVCRIKESVRFVSCRWVNQSECSAADCRSTAADVDWVIILIHKTCLVDLSAVFCSSLQYDGHAARDKLWIIQVKLQHSDHSQHGPGMFKLQELCLLDPSVVILHNGQNQDAHKIIVDQSD